MSNTARPARNRHILSFLDEGYQINTVGIKIGRTLAKGEKSKSGAYAIMAHRKNLTLRISLHQSVAELFCDYDSRYLAECWIEKGSMERVDKPMR